MVIRRTLVVVVVAFVWGLAIAADAHADVDLTGDWIVEYDNAPFTGLTTQTATLVQTGSSLTWGSLVGPIDP